MGNAGRDGGQYYTPRPLIRVMIRILDPKVGEKFDDGACGSAGFICELDLKGVSLGKTRPLNEQDLAEFEPFVYEWKAGRAVSMKPPQCTAHWTVDPATLDQTTLDLSVNNPNRVEEELPTAAECRAKIAAIYEEIGEVLGEGER